MHINIIKRKVDFAGEQEQKTIERCKRLCDRFLDGITSMTIRLSDINGPKGGVDKECVAQIHLRNGHVITAVKRHESIQGAIHRSLETARSLLRRKLGQRKRRQRFGSDPLFN